MRRPCDAVSLAVVLAAAALILPACVGHTDDATNLTATSATLNAHGKSTDGAARAFFRWGTSPNALTNSTPGVNYPANVEGPHAETITGLSPSTTYYFRACAVDNAGTLCAEIHDFKTLASNGDAVVAAVGDIGDDTPSPNGQDETGAVDRVARSQQGHHAGRQRLRERHAGRVQRQLPAVVGRRDQRRLRRAERLRRPHAPGRWATTRRPTTPRAPTTSSTASTPPAVRRSTCSTAWPGLRGQGYYIHDVGSWRLIALNSRNGGPIEQAQLDWLAPAGQPEPQAVPPGLLAPPALDLAETAGWTTTPTWRRSGPGCGRPARRRSAPT